MQTKLKKSLSILLTLVMLVGLLPTMAFAEGEHSQPPADYSLSVSFDQDRGSVFYAAGAGTPGRGKDDYFFQDQTKSFNTAGESGQPSIGRVNLRLDPTQIPDWDKWDPELGGNHTFELMNTEQYTASISVLVLCEPSTPDGTDGLEKVVVEFGQQKVSMTNTYNFAWDAETNILSFTPQSERPMRVEVWWTRGSYEYDSFGPTEDCPIIVELEDYGNGAGSIIPSVDNGDIVSYGSREKVCLPLECDSVRISWESSSIDPTRLWVEGLGDVDLSAAVDKTYTLRLNQTISAEDGSGETSPKDYYRVELYFPDGEPREPFQPGVRLNAKDLLESTSNLTLNGEVDDAGWIQYSFTEDTTHGIVFKSTTDQNYHGIKVRSFGADENPANVRWSYQRLETGSYTFDGEDYTSRCYEIEVIDWDHKTYDGEFAAMYDNRFGTVTVTPGTADATSEDMTPDTPYEFTPGVELTFGISGMPYRVEVCPNDGEPTQLDVDSQLCYYTPQDETGFELRVWWSEEEYLFDTLKCNWEEEFIAEYQVFYDNCDEYAGTVELTPTPAEGKSASYDGRTRVVFSRNADGQPFDVTLNINPAAGFDYTLKDQGGNKTSSTIDNNSYTWRIGGTDDSCPEIQFFPVCSNPNESGECHHAAAIGETHYDTLAAAIAAATSEDTIVLLQDHNSQLTIPEDKTVSIRLNGHRFANDITVSENSTLNISGRGNGNFDTYGYRTLNLCGSGTVNINNCTFYDDIDTNDQIKLNIQNGTFEGDIDSYDASVVTIRGGVFNDVKSRAQSTMTIYGGTFNDDVDSCDDSCMKIYDGTFTDDPDSRGNSRMEIYGGTFTNDIECRGTSTMIINGGTFHAGDEEYGVAVYVEYAGKLTIKNGVFWDDVYVFCLGSVTIRGGTFYGDIVTDGHDSYCDCADQNAKCAVTIEDGTFMGELGRTNDGGSIAVRGGTFTQDVCDFTDGDAVVVQFAAELNYGIIKPYTNTFRVNNSIPGLTRDLNDFKNAPNALFTIHKAPQGASMVIDSFPLNINIHNLTNSSVTLNGHVIAPGWQGSLTDLSNNNNNNNNGGYVAPTYSIDTDKTENGSISVSPKSASMGTTMTITATPDEGYELDALTVLDKDGKEIKLTEKDGKYTFTMPASKVTVEASFKKIAIVNPFVDVNKNMWSYDDILYVYEKGLMQGTSNTTFAPALTTNRAMILTILYRLEGEPAVTGTSSFGDVASNTWYSKAVVWAEQNGIVNGYPDGNLGINDDISREQLATILYRYMQFKGMNVATTSEHLTSFSDHEQVSGYAVQAMNWAVANGLISGADNKLMPKDGATREQIAAILHRFCENVLK